MIRVVISNEDLILCFRDSCKLFDIREKFDSVDQKDMTRNVCIRLVMRMAKDVRYINTLKYYDHKNIIKKPLTIEWFFVLAILLEYRHK